MSRIPAPATVQDAPEASRAILDTLKKQIGSVPNIFRLVGTSPTALSALTGLQATLAKGALPAATRERIALASAQANGCDYCLAAHTFTGAKVAKLDAAEIVANRRGTSNDPHAAAAVEFAAALIRTRGAVDAASVAAVRDAGYDNAQILEIVAHVALNTFTNYVNEAFETDIDFPRVPRDAAGTDA